MPFVVCLRRWRSRQQARRLRSLRSPGSSFFFNKGPRAAAFAPAPLLPPLSALEFLRRREKRPSPLQSRR